MFIELITCISIALGECPLYVSDFTASKKGISPDPFALMAYQTTTFKSCNRTPCIGLGLFADQYLLL